MYNNLEPLNIVFITLLFTNYLNMGVNAHNE